MLWSRALATGFARVVEKPLLENQLVDGTRGSCSSEDIRERRVARHLRMST